MTKKLRITVEGKAYDVTVDTLDAAAAVAAPAPVAAAPAPVAAAPAPVAAPAPAPKAAAPAASGAGVLKSPLAGKVDSIDVKVGDTITDGQTVVTLEAMKMKTTVPSDGPGVVKAIHVKVGDAVEEGQALVTVG